MTEPTTRLSPSVAHVSLQRKLSEAVELLQLYRREARAGHDFSGLFAELDEYDELLRAHADVALADATVFEIGFGARPYRQIALQSMGVDVRGVDAEAPVLNGGPSHYVEMLRKNGAERAAKSLVRHLFFDRGEERALDRALRERGLTRRLDPARLLIADAGSIELEESSLDLVFSEDVFEHVERDTLGRVVAAMAHWLRPGGLALVRPNVFTGITGGHLIEWSRRALKAPPASRRSEPWEHLRQRRYAPNTFLNELTRTDYRTLFTPYFEILAERVTQPSLGREHLDERARAELQEWPDEELFSNQTLFVLRPRKA